MTSSFRQALMVLRLPMNRPTRMMKMSRDVAYAKIPAPPFEACPHCHEMNLPDRARVWRVKNERGTWLECDVCAHAEPYPDFQVP